MIHLMSHAQYTWSSLSHRSQLKVQCNCCILWFQISKVGLSNEPFLSLLIFLLPRLQTDKGMPQCKMDCKQSEGKNEEKKLFKGGRK